MSTANFPQWFLDWLPQSVENYNAEDLADMFQECNGEPVSGLDEAQIGTSTMLTACTPAQSPLRIWWVRTVDRQSLWWTGHGWADDHQLCHVFTCEDDARAAVEIHDDVVPMAAVSHFTPVL